MNTNLILTILFLFSGIGSLFAQQTELKQLRDDVTFLAHDSLEGRAIGTHGEEIAAEYIAGRYEKLGLKPLKDNASYFQVFKHNLKAHPHDTAFSGAEVIGKNVIGMIDNKAKSTIIIGAHYDHLGWGDQSSLSADSAIHNGADDNASGVAGLLFLADHLSNTDLQHNVVFIAFTGEEKGLLGSHYFVEHTLSQLHDVSFMVNMDMIGRLDSLRRLAINGIGTSPSFVPAIESIKSPEFAFSMDSSGMGPSDHTSFYLNKVPVLHFFTGQHPQYHKPEDDVELINFEGLYDVSDYILKLVRELDKEEQLTFVKTKDKSKDKRHFNVSLGIIPDYLYDGKGLKIDGVKDDRTADKAKLQRGDIVIQMGTIVINDIHDYMKALNSFNKGDSVEITYIRKDKEYTTTALFE